MRTISSLSILAACLAAAAPAQQPAPQDLDAAYRKLRAELEPGAAEDAPDRATRIARWSKFIERHAESAPGALAVLEARWRLGTLLLCHFETERARAEFSAVLDASRRAKLDLRGRCMYGIAQAFELEGKRIEARRALQRLTRRFAGTQYGEMARRALRRLEDEKPIETAQPAPEFGARLDLTGASRKLAALRGAPVVLVFWSPDAEGIERAERVIDAARGAGLPTAQIVTFGIDTDANLLARTVERRRWKVPVVPLTDRYVDPVVLRYGVDSLPSSFLIGPAGILLARDLSPKRLRRTRGELVGPR